MSYQNAQVCPGDGNPLGGTGQLTVSRLLSTIGTGLLLPRPQLAVACARDGRLVVEPEHRRELERLLARVVHGRVPHCGPQGVVTLLEPATSAAVIAAFARTPASAASSGVAYRGSVPPRAQVRAADSAAESEPFTSSRRRR